jgi:hypothetical protein
VTIPLFQFEPSFAGCQLSRPLVSNEGNLGRIIVPFAPSWVGTIESRVGSYLRSGEKTGVSNRIQGKTINIDDAYLLSQKVYIQDFLSEEFLEWIKKH